MSVNELRQIQIPEGRQGVFIGVPIKYPDDYMDGSRSFLNLLLRENDNPTCPYFYILNECVGVNAPYATSSLANDFIVDGKCEWFLLWSDDLCSTPQDCRRLLDTANRDSLDIISGVVVKKPTPVPDFRWTAISGNFSNDDPNCPTINLCLRGKDITDLDVINYTVKQFDVVGGGCAFFRKKVIESLCPEKNDGLAYWCYDKQMPAYDLRVFQRLKEKGFAAYQDSGVLWGHIGLKNTTDGNGNKTKTEYPYTFWDIPICRNVPGMPDKIREEFLICA